MVSLDLLRVILKYHDDALWFYRNGNGRRVQPGIWINPDLTKQERDAKYIARVKQRLNRNRPMLENANDDINDCVNEATLKLPVTLQSETPGNMTKSSTTDDVVADNNSKNL